MTPTLLLLLLSSGVNAPAPMATREPWIGELVCCKPPDAQPHERKADGSFAPTAISFRYMAFRVVDEVQDFVAVQQDDTVFWLRKTMVLRPREAITHFSEKLEANSSDYQSLYSRSWAYLTVKDFDRALQDIEHAERVAPANPAHRINRGIIYLKQKEYPKALAEFDAILGKNPGYYYALSNRAEVHLQLKHFQRALQDTRQALEAEPRVPGLQMLLARIQATAPDPKLRDGKEAVANARKAVQALRYRDGRFLDTLAAAYAEAGDFDRAVEAMQRALDDPEFMKDEGTQARKRLELYRGKQPFRDE